MTQWSRWDCSISSITTTIHSLFNVLSRRVRRGFTTARPKPRARACNGSICRALHRASPRHCQCWEGDAHIFFRPPWATVWVSSFENNNQFSTILWHTVAAEHVHEVKTSRSSVGRSIFLHVNARPTTANATDNNLKKIALGNSVAFTVQYRPVAMCFSHLGDFYTLYSTFDLGTHYISYTYCKISIYTNIDIYKILTISVFVIKLL